ncbi:MAG: hypothetical protein HETSPECPRED_004187 [Heterodermia speciosa]|uniref:Glycoside hydrolase family 17 protein n=1 Tax=Heterodermia speciosa TaxID=116794 RepID=A0A8H3IIM6_9LECA|nr:MAG: hypothetical protein HETSPECPRED_004187 [Heterodermia speciosa]
MKTGIFTTLALVFLQLAAAQPHARVRHKHAKRQGPNVKVVTDVEYVTVDAEDIVVYVDEHGRPVTTKTVYHSQAGPTVAPTSSSSSSPIYFPTHHPHPHPHPQSPSALAPSYHPIPVPLPGPTTKSALVPESTSSSTPASVPEPATTPRPSPNTEPSSSQPASASLPSNPGPVADGPGFGSAISYSPYNSDNTCKSATQVASDFAKMSGYEVIRLYGTDCNQLANVRAATQDTGVSLFLGIFDINQVQSECQTIIDAMKGDWSHVNTVSVGNELVNNGGASVSQVTSAIGQARSILKGAGYTGPVVTVDTMMAMKANPELCHASDFCAINCHAFFDGKTTAEKSGDFVLNWAKEVSEAAGGKTTVITETGWPSQGQTNGMAVPSLENQQAAIASIKRSFPRNAILYSSYNCMWKKNSASTFGAEQYWGILGTAPSG